MIKTTLMAAAALTLSASTTFAGYTIYQEDDYPSVMFIEIEGEPVEEPSVISAPSSVSTDPMLPVTSLQGDEFQPIGGSTTPNNEPSSIDTAVSSQESQPQEPTFEQRVERNMRLGDTTDQAVQRAINEEELERAQLR